ncbi:hypothetical protein BC826DRAFT_979798 [Russula brevipes]|nr:hypothetical protein BC826DRAFT_979798 [Russula brevipes]
MNIKSFSALLFYVALTRAHEGHSDEPVSGDATHYAQRHVRVVFHISRIFPRSFDLPSFFQLHDLNRDGVWDAEEVEAIYGVHHVYSQKKSKDDEEHQAKAKLIVETVFNAMDSDKDGTITLSEFEAAGLDALPSFENLGAEGHHYDVESGISVEEALAQHGEAVPNEQPPAESAKVDGEEVPKKFERQTPPEEQDPVIRFRQAKAESEAHGEWGAGDSGYKPPNSPSERMRKNLPYKVTSYFVFDGPLLEVDIGAYAVQVPPELG